MYQSFILWIYLIHQANINHPIEYYNYPLVIVENDVKKKLTISVIICTRNRIDCLPDCLTSLAHQKTSIDELIIVDSSDIPLICHDVFNDLFNTTVFGGTLLMYRHTKAGLTYQ